MDAVVKYERTEEYAKVGTIPMAIIRDRSIPLEVGGRVRWQEMEGGRWHTGILIATEPILFIDRM